MDKSVYIDEKTIFLEAVFIDVSKCLLNKAFTILLSQYQTNNYV